VFWKDVSVVYYPWKAVYGMGILVRVHYMTIKWWDCNSNACLIYVIIIVLLKVIF